MPAEIYNLLYKSKELGVQLWSDNGQLRYKGPKEHLSLEFLESLKSKKNEIIQILQTFETFRDLDPIPLASRHKEDIHHLSFSQQRLWFLDQFQPGSPFYNIPATVRLSGALNRDALCASLNEVIRRHEALRTTFTAIDGAPTQVIASELIIDLPVIDISDLPTDVRETRSMALVREKAAQPFDLCVGPLLRAHLIRLADEDHLILVCIHHIVSDGWSMGIIVREIAAVYNALTTGRQSPLAPLPIQYVDFAAWQRQWLKGERLERQLQYWKKQLDGAPPLLTLPTDRPRPAAQTFSGSRIHFTIPKDVSARLQTLSARVGTTLFMTLVAAFNVLLHRYSGQTDICVGTPIANRNHADIEGLIGCFMSMLVLRSDLKGNPTFVQLLTRVRETALSAYSHQDLPFEQLIDELKPERSLSHSPWFQVMFTLQNAASEKIDLIGLSLRTISTDLSVSKYDLALQIIEGSDQLFGTLEYNIDLFNRETVERIAQSFDTLLRSITTEPDLPIADLDLIPLSEKRKIVVEWNDTSTPYQTTKAVHELFEEMASRTPDQIALVFGDQELTYAELNLKANQLARHLCSAGVRSETVVAVCAERSLDLVIGLIAVLKAGGVYLPLDPAYPKERLTHMLEDAKPSIVLTHGVLIDTLPQLGIPYFCLERTGDCISSELSTNLNCSIRSDQLAYVIYTSGSTGKPKGIGQTHRQLLNRLNWFWERFPFKGETVGCQKTSINFVDSLWEIFGFLLQGAKTVIVPNEVLHDHSSFLDTIAANKITHLSLVPSLLKALLDNNAGLRERIPTLGFWCPSGEPLTSGLIAQFRREFPLATLLNLYGLSEGWDATYSNCESIAIDMPAVIGRPLFNVQIYLLDPYLNPVPIGVSGQLFIAGDCLARGYFNRPDLTAEKFLPCPFSEILGARMYATGDLARYLPDGNIEYLGRIDHQVKIRGFRIELAEVEAALTQHPAVREVIVHAREDIPDDKRLVAYVVTHEKTVQPQLKELRDWLLQRLPGYMVPTYFVFLDRLPLTPNGKINRNALPAPAALHSLAEYVAPRTEIECVVAAVWSETLKLDKISIYDRFFDIGGHSLLATRLVGDIAKITGVKMGLNELLDSQTIEAMSRFIRTSSPERHAEKDFPDIAEDLESRFEPFPLTPIQQAYWLGRSGHFELGNSATYVYFEIDVKNLDTKRFEKAWNQLIHRHEMLRAVITPDGQQRILKPGSVHYSLSIEDVRLLADKSDHLQNKREKLSHQILPADVWPLFDIRATQYADDLYRLHFGIDIIFVDGWSLRLLFNEFDIYYREQTPPPAISLSFRDFILAEQRFKTEGHIERCKSYWTRRVNSLPPAPNLPINRDPASIKTPRFLGLQSQIDKSVWDKLKANAALNNVTPSVLVLSAFSDVLKLWSNSDHFTINLTLFNRPPVHQQINMIIGDFTSLILLEVDKRERRSFAHASQELQKQLWTDIDHKHFTGTDVLRELTKVRADGKPVLMPVVFTSELSLSNQDLGDQRPATRMSGRGVYRIAQTPQAWLDHKVAERDGALQIMWDYVADLFPEYLIKDMFEAFLLRLKQLTDEDTWYEPGPWSFVPERQLENSRTLNATTVPRSRPIFLHTLTENSFEHFPNSLALLTHDLQLTYRDLDELSYGLSLKLQKGGIKPGSMVAVWMSKGWEQIVAVLAILRTGAIYLPLDGTLPTDRRNMLLTEGQVAVVLTQASLLAKAPLPANFSSLVVDDDCRMPRPKEFQRYPANDGCLAYVIFTSGSTGKPKGVMIDHHGAANTILDINRRFKINQSDCVLALSSLTFDLSVFDIFGILGAGGTVTMPREAELRDPKAWVHYIIEKKVTVLNAVPALVQLIVEEFERSSVTFPPHLRLVMMSGDWIPITLPERIRRISSSDCQIVSLGGATEVSIWSVYHEIAEIRPEWVSIPYGRPLENQTVYVLQSDFNLSPEWVPGELYIGGSGVAKGYWNDSVKTQERFVVNPKSGETLYRTGDRARLLPNGELEFLGRLDSQVKIQGYRVELGEIESALLQCPAIDQCAVAVHQDAQGNNKLVAYVVPKELIKNQLEQDLNIPRGTRRKQLKLKFSQLAIRTKGLAPTSVPLIASSSSAANEKIYAYLDGAAPLAVNIEQSDRHLSFKKISACLEVFKQTIHKERPLPKYAYPSAGSLYPVQVYVELLADVEALKAGSYYYNPAKHHLSPIASATNFPRRLDPIDSELQQVLIHLVAERNAIDPIYPQLALNFCQLEAGYMFQALSGNARANDCSVTLIPSADQNAIKELFDLQSSQELIGTLSLTLIRNLAVNTEPSRLAHDPVESFEKPGRYIALPMDTVESNSDISIPRNHRKAFRHFSSDAIPLATLSKILFGVKVGLKGWQANTRLEKTSSFRLLISVHTGAISGIESGCYLYDPEHHRLLHSDIELPSSEDHEPVNRNIFDQSKIGFYFLTQGANDDIESPILEGNLLRAGYLGQLLTNVAAHENVGLCPIGAITSNRFLSSVNRADYLLLHCFLGGAVNSFDMDEKVSEPTHEKRMRPEEDLRTYLSNRLPSYMIPHTFVPLANLPLSENGKIDRKALPPPELPIDENAYIPPGDETERHLDRILSGILGIDKVSVSTPFFSLGANSLDLIRLHRQISEELDVSISMADLFEHTTIRQIAALMAGKENIDDQLDDIRKRAQQQRSAIRNKQKRKTRN